MPCLKTARRIASVKNNNAKTIGQIYKENSDWCMEQTWDNNIQSKTCYIYDYLHDDQPALKDHMTYENTTKTQIDAKFIVSQYGSITKDQIAYHLMFRPSQQVEFSKNDELYYFETDYRKKWNVTFPVGLYIDIPNEKGIYEKWLIVSIEQGNQFIKYSILPINYLFEWIETDGQNRYKRSMWGCDRQQLSYSSGVWRDLRFESPDNIEKAILPLNEITKNIRYVNDENKNQRLIISAKIDNPLVWRITKVENTKPFGLIQLTFKQDLFNQHNDFIEKDEQGNIIGMWADYYNSGIKPINVITSDTPASVYGKITASTAFVKVGGSYKTLTLNLYDADKNEITDNYSDATFEWSCSISDGNKMTLLTDKVTWLNGRSFNQKKIKFPDDRSFLNKVLNITCVIKKGSETVETNAQFELII